MPAEQIVQLIGAVLILSGFILAQFGVMRPQSLSYLLLNLSGSAILAALAYLDHQWGFFLLEGVWALVSAWGLIVLWRGLTPTANH